MEALLVDEWLEDVRSAPSTAVLDEASLSVVRQSVRDVGAAQQLSTETVEAMVLAATELGRNQLRHAVGGRVAVRGISRAGVPGLEIVAADRGEGIANPAAALAGAPRVTGTLGVGLAAVRDLASEVDFDVRLGEGTLVRARRFAAGVPRRRQVGVFGRAIPGETASGDHACFVRNGDQLVLGVCDGLGHGMLARQASSVALRAFHDHASASPVGILEACNAALHRTRGAVMAVARLLEAAEAIEVASVGNIGVQAVGPRQVQRFGGSSFVLGTPPQRVKKIFEERAPLPEGHAVVLFSDGISSRLTIENDLMLLREHPIVIAATIVREHARAEDDVLVLVAR